MQRNYDSISPSARSLLLTKGLTDIPFMADAARLVWGDAAKDMLTGRMDSELFLVRLMHFEARYKSLQNLLLETGLKNILEISSGFSFRGLDMALVDPDVFYIDTDLPGVIADKNHLVDSLITQKQLELKGELLIHELNALDNAAFNALIEKLPAGPVCIANEGLLMYLNINEKTQLCEIIREVLLRRGGYWITADIYIKKQIGRTITPDAVNAFLDAHNVEENKFDSFAQAEDFFKQRGLKLHKKAQLMDRSQISSLKYVDVNLINNYIQKVGGLVRIRETWALEAI